MLPNAYLRHLGGGSVSHLSAFNFHAGLEVIEGQQRVRLF